MDAKGIFLTIEGGEGSGKTTLSNAIASYFREKGREVICTREPGGTALGEKIRLLLLEGKDFHISAHTELFLFLASRAQHIEEVIFPAIQRKAVVICDRFSDSTIAYQGAGRNLGVEYVSSCCSLVAQGLEPELTFFIDVDSSLGKTRVKERLAQSARGSEDRIEKEMSSFHERVRGTFITLAQKFPQRIVTIDGTKTKEEVLEQAKKALHTYGYGF